MSKLNIPEPVIMYLTRIQGKIKKGEYSSYLNIPFATKDLLYKVIEEKVLDRSERGVNPMLNEREIMECVQATLSIAAETAGVFINSGFLVKNEEGVYEVSPKGKIALESIRAEKRGK